MYWHTVPARFIPTSQEDINGNVHTNGKTTTTTNNNNTNNNTNNNNSNTPTNNNGSTCLA